MLWKQAFVDTEFESERSARRTSVDASAAGARAMTATSSQGLALFQGGRLQCLLASPPNRDAGREPCPPRSDSS